jgi:hypothetical protein
MNQRTWIRRYVIWASQANKNAHCRIDTFSRPCPVPRRNSKLLTQPRPFGLLSVVLRQGRGSFFGWTFGIRIDRWIFLLFTFAFVLPLRTSSCSKLPAQTATEGGRRLISTVPSVRRRVARKEEDSRRRTTSGLRQQLHPSSPYDGCPQTNKQANQRAY